MPLLDDYTGAFDPDLDLAGFSRQALAHLGREFLLNGHLQDRVGLPLVVKHLGGDAYVELVVNEMLPEARLVRGITAMQRPIPSAMRRLVPSGMWTVSRRCFGSSLTVSSTKRATSSFDSHAW